MIFDDPLSAGPYTPTYSLLASLTHGIVDAHVGKALFANAIIGALRNRGKTVILVTHALHFMSQCDYIYTMQVGLSVHILYCFVLITSTQNGRIEEQGTYTDLIANGKEFSRLMQEFGGQSKEEEEEAEAEEDITVANVKLVTSDLDEAKNKSESVQRKGAGTGKLEGRLIVKEHRTTGSVSWRGMFVLPLRASFS